MPLAQVAQIELVDGQTLVARENGNRRITVRTDIVGRDQNGFVQEAKRVFEQKLEKDRPPGYRVNWIGMFENLEHAIRHFQIVLLVAILGLLPASLATGLGSDVQRPLATVIVWGLLSSTILTLFVVPVLYDLFNPGLPVLDEVPRETLVS